MSKDALKFTNLDAFFEAAEGMGFDGELRGLIYEQDRLPYCSAYLIPTDLLPPGFDLSKRSLFGGSITRIEEIRYLGTERFSTDFMIYPLSLTGFLEVESYSQPLATHLDPFDDPEGKNMNFVINIEDGGGKEFYLAQSGSLIGLADASTEEPQVFKTAKQVNKQVDVLREKHSEACQVYALERQEFDARRKQLLAE